MEVLQVNSRGRHLAVLAFAVVAMASSACGDPKKPPPKFRLEGSLTQVMELGYDEARILVAPEDVSLLFVRIRPLGSDPGIDDGGTVDPMMMTGQSEDYPLKVAYRLLGDPAGGRVDLATLDTNGAQRGTVSRNVANDPRNTLPPLVRGTMYFDRALDPGVVVHGDFNVTFENGIDAASGRTAFSTSFSAKVQP